MLYIESPPQDPDCVAHGMHDRDEENEFRYVTLGDPVTLDQWFPASMLSSA